MEYDIIKKTFIGFFILFIIVMIFHLKEQLKVPTQCDFDECFTNVINLDEVD